jgi:hypothetical protein
MSVKNILEAIAVTAELTGTELSVNARVAMAEELAIYPEAAVLDALRRCRKEVRGNRLTMADVMTRINDGRPGAEEAWALYPKNETGSAAVTEEMQCAMSAAWPLIQEGDRVAARMAFKESYERIITENRAKNIAVKWSVSLGTNTGEREAALVDAVQRQRISVDRAMGLLPHTCEPERFLMSVGATNHKLLEAPKNEDKARIENNRARLRLIISELLPDENRIAAKEKNKGAA